MAGAGRADGATQPGRTSQGAEGLPRGGFDLLNAPAAFKSGMGTVKKGENNE